MSSSGSIEIVDVVLPDDDDSNVSGSSRHVHAQSELDNVFVNEDSGITFSSVQSCDKRFNSCPASEQSQSNNRLSSDSDRHISSLSVQSTEPDNEFCSDNSVCVSSLLGRIQDNGSSSDDNEYSPTSPLQGENSGFVSFDAEYTPASPCQTQLSNTSVISGDGYMPTSPLQNVLSNSFASDNECIQTSPLRNQQSDDINSPNADNGYGSLMAELADATYQQAHSPTQASEDCDHSDSDIIASDNCKKCKLTNKSAIGDPITEIFHDNNLENKLNELSCSVSKNSPYSNNINADHTIGSHIENGSSILSSRKVNAPVINDSRDFLNDVRVCQPPSAESPGLCTTISIYSENSADEEQILDNDCIMHVDDAENTCEKSFDLKYDFSHIPAQITGSWKEFSSKTRNNFTRGCKWAPDGSCILTCSDDSKLRIFNLPPQLWNPSEWCEIAEMETAVMISEGEMIYDFSWYPLMNSNDPATCCLVSASRHSSIHLWDGFTGELRCSYRSYNHLDELVTPFSLSFDADGQRIFCGYNNLVRIFDVNRPGRNFQQRKVYSQKFGQSGIISSFAFDKVHNVSAAGSFLNTVGLYSEPSGHLQFILDGHTNGITQLQFSPCGNYLYSGARKHADILCWDLRNVGQILFAVRRSIETNQRMYFDVSGCGKYIVSGNQNGVVTIWDIRKEPEVISEDAYGVVKPIQFFLAHDDCVNGISLHPHYPLLCSSSGQRKFAALQENEEDDSMFSMESVKRDNSLRLWWLGKLN